MAQAYVHEKIGVEKTVVTHGLPDKVAGLAAFIYVAFLAFVSIYLQAPPKAAPESAPPADFSSARAMNQLQTIARNPHPIASNEHAEVRRFIVERLAATGLTAEIQERTAVTRSGGGPFVAGTVRNIIARLKGTSHTKAVVIVGHYDSAATSRGASDDGSAVAAMLETARALTVGPRLKNDVIFLFTDGEEAGLLGAKAFIDDPVWRQDIGLALNFEARGNSGPSYMFETSPNNRWLVEEFAKAASYPLASSLAPEIYKLLPNDTDLTVFKEANLPCLNFAFIGGKVYYHSLIDDARSIDERSLQHQGSYMLSLARHFGNLDLTTARAGDEGNAVYFNLLGGYFVRYSVNWTHPLVAMVALVFIAVMVLGFRRRLLTLSGVSMGSLAFLINLIVAPAVIFLAWQVILRMHAGYAQIPQGDTYNSHLYMVGFVAFAVAVSYATYRLFRKKVSLYNLAAGALGWWMVFTVASAFYLPGVNYLFAWPLLFSLVALWLTFSWKDASPITAKKVVVICLCVVPSIILIAPVIHQLFVALTVSLAGPVMIAVALLAGPLIPHFELASFKNKWALPGALTLAGMTFILAGGLTSGFDADHPKPDSVFYVLDTDKSKAIWASSDHAPDQWTSQFLSATAGKGTMFDYFPLSPRLFLKVEAPMAALTAPEARLIEESPNGAARTLRLHISSPRQAPVVSIYVDQGDQVIEASIDGKPIDGGQPPILTAGFLAGHLYGLPADGVDLVLKTKPSQSVKIRLVDRSYELPHTIGTSFRPRPADLIPAALSNSDSTFVSKTFTF